MGHPRLTSFSFYQAILCWSQGRPPSQCVGHDPCEALHSNPSLALHSKGLLLPVLYTPFLFALDLSWEFTLPPHTPVPLWPAPRFHWVLDNLANGMSGFCEYQEKEQGKTLSHETPSGSHPGSFLFSHPFGSD